MTVKKPVPCSYYDIPGMQEWLDEMALQGLFLVEFSPHSDRAVFEQGEPKPARYRLDPIGKNKKQDWEREDPYAEMGWKFVCQLHKRFYVFSCDNPETPELYTDHQSLAVALDSLTKREVWIAIFVALLGLSTFALVLFMTRGQFLLELLLWESPRALVLDIVFLIALFVLLPWLALETKRILNIHRTLAQGLPLKAKRRWNRPLYLAWYIPLWCLVFVVPRLFIPDVGWETGDLETMALSHTWPTFRQLEVTGPRPLEEEPEIDGYATLNSSYFAPIQEFSSSGRESLYRLDPTTGDYLPNPQRDYPLWKGVRYVQVGSPKLANLIYRTELADAAKTLDRWAKSKWVASSARVTGYTGFEPRDWPGVDRLEVARYRQHELDCWAFAALRGTDILVVRYQGFARWEDCLPLFLEALNGEEAAS